MKRVEHTKNIIENKMNFIIGDSKYCKIKNSDSHFYITDDTSLLYNGLYGDYSVLLGGNWRFELIVDSFTGLCTQVQSFLSDLEVISTTLELPKAVFKDLYFVRNESLEPGEGCHYFPFVDKVFWDVHKKILCYGDPNANGEAVEFTSRTIAVVDNKQLMCIYLMLDNIEKDIFSW